MSRHDGGWIKLHRALIDHPAACDSTTLGLFVRLLLMANWKESRARFDGKLITISPGQILTGRDSLAEATGLSRSTLERKLKWFEECGTIGQQMGTKGRIITINNWDTYQNISDALEQQTDSRWTADGQQMDSRWAHSEEGKKEKREEGKSKERRAVVWQYEEIDLKAVTWFQRQVKLANPLARRIDSANLEQWANEVRLMRERDGLTHERIGEVMAWALQDSFWSVQIQSIAKLREKWDTLTARMAIPQVSGFRPVG